MTLGTMEKDCEIRIDYNKLRKDRLKKAKNQLKTEKLGALLCFDPDAIRYITSTKLNDWTNNKLARASLLAADKEPILYEVGSAIETKEALCPWMKGRILPFVGGFRGSFPGPVVTENTKKFAGMISSVLREFGVHGEPLGIDIIEIPLMKALEKEGIHVVDGQQTLLNAQAIKTPEEVALIETSISIVEAAFWQVVHNAHPGKRESEISALMRKTMYELGTEEIQNINVITGNRSHPHPHDFSDRIIRPGDLIFIDVVNVFNGYKTCYYQTFICGKPSQKQLDIYKQCYDWLWAGIEMLKPGMSTAEIAKAWPTAKEMGFKDESEAWALQIGHGVGITHWAKPVISRLFSSKYPEEIKENMVVAMENYAGSGEDGVRIEEMLVVTKEGYRQLTKFPSKNIISCPLVWAVYP
jgi:Xaa-Pro aminopeptidase